MANCKGFAGHQCSDSNGRKTTAAAQPVLSHNKGVNGFSFREASEETQKNIYPSSVNCRK